MAGETQNREVSLDFTIKGDAETKAGQLGKALEHVQHAAESANARIASFGKSAAIGALGAMGLSYGLRELWTHAKEVNLSLESTQKRLAGATFAFSTWKAGTSGISKWNESMRDGAAILEKLESVSRREKMSREDLASIYETQSMMSERYRQSQAQQLQLTERLAATQNVLGVSAEGAADMIGRAAMSGTIMLRSSLGRQLASGIGNLKAFKKASEEVRFEKLKKALGDMVPASVAMGQGMKGALFDIHEAATMLTRDLSAPLFAAQTQSLREWAANLTRIREDGKSISQEYGEKIAKAFTVIKDVSGGIAQHWQLIAGMLVAGKVGGMMKGALGAFGVPAGSAGGAAGGLMGGAVASMTVNAGTVSVNSGGLGALGAASTKAITQSTSSGLAKFASGLARGASQAFVAAEAVGALAVAAAAWVDEWQTENLREQQVAPVQTMNALHAGMTAMKTTGEEQARHMKTVSEAFGLKAGQHVSAASIESGLRTMSIPESQKLAQAYGFKGSVSADASGEFAPHVAAQIAENLNRMIDMAVKAHGIDKAADAMTDKEKAKKAVGDIHVGTVNITQDFKEANPEHVFHQVISDINQLGHAPGQALTARGGR